MYCPMRLKPNIPHRTPQVRGSATLQMQYTIRNCTYALELGTLLSCRFLAFSHCW
jgi:hypothetical protein